MQTGDKLAKPPFFVAYSRLCRHCRNLVEGGCRLSRFHFRLCRYFLGHVAGRNLPWQGLILEEDKDKDKDKAETPEDLLAPHLDHPC